MVGVPDLFSGRSVAYGLASLGTMSSRPNFELQFNILQNSIVDRINKEIEKVNEAATENTVDAFLLQSQRKLDLFKYNLETFTFFNSRNAWTIPELKTKLTALEGTLSVIPSPDTAAFDTILAQINDIVGNMQPPNGTMIGIFLEDGISAIRRDGLLNVTRGGVVEPVTSYSQFTDVAEAQAAITSAQSELNSSFTSVMIKAESAEKLRVKTEQNLTSVTFQIEAARTAAEADKAMELTKLREKYGQLLNALSLAFEGNQAMAESLGKGLFNPNNVEPGSVMNIFS